MNASELELLLEVPGIKEVAVDTKEKIGAAYLKCIKAAQDKVDFLVISTTTTTPSSASPEWTVLYHMPGKLKGRGEFLRLMLEDAGKSYVNDGETLYGPTGRMDMFRETADDILSDMEAPSSICSFPCLYPPAILHRPADGTEEVLVNQVGACMIYVADVLGYAPATPAEKARANCIMMNAIDYLADGRASFHPVKNTLSYHEQTEEGDRVSKEFAAGRMLKYLAYFHKLVHRAGPHAPVAGGPEVTFADFALFHVLDATVAQFNTEHYDMAWDRLAAPALTEYYTWMGARPNLVAYFASERRFPWAGDSMM